MSVERPRKVLIVEDDQATLMLFHRIATIVPGGLEILQAEDGQEALERIAAMRQLGAEHSNTSEAQLPDLIVSDIQMPRLNGIELAKKLSEDTETASIPILFISATILDHTDLQGYDLYDLSNHNQRHIEARQKPIGAVEFIALIQAMLGMDFQLPIIKNASPDNNKPDDQTPPSPSRLSA